MGDDPTQRARAGLPRRLAALFYDLLLVVAIVHDWRTNGRVHPAYIVAGAFVVLVQIARVPLSTTDAWRSFADWLMAFTG